MFIVNKRLFHIMSTLIRQIFYQPVVVGVDVGEGYYLAAFEGCEAVVELGLASGGEP